MLPKKNRLTKEKDFKQVIKKGRSFFISEFGIKFLKKKSLSPTKIGIVIPKKITRTIVKRNRVKRQIRHIFFDLIEQMPPRYQIVFLARADLLKLEFKKMQEKIIAVLKQVNLLKNKK